MNDKANLSNPLDSQSTMPTSPTLPMTRTHIYLLAAALLAVWALYSASPAWDQVPRPPLRGPVPSTFLLGNTPDLYSRLHGFAYHHTLPATYGRAFKIHMFAGEEQIYLSDTRALAHVLVRDTHVFDETPAMTSEFYYCFGPGLIAVRADTHKKSTSDPSLVNLRRAVRQRKMIQPLFGAAHIRALTPTFWSIAHQLSDVIRARSFDALDDGTEDNAFMVAVRELPYTVYPLHKFMPICIWCMQNLPVWLQHVLARLAPLPQAQKVRRIVETMQRNSEALYAAKKTALLEGNVEAAEQVGEGSDVMSVLMKANMAAAEKEKENLPDEEVLGQMNTFIAAGHDTMSSALARLLHSLATDLPRQGRLREELTRARAETFGELNFRTVTSLPFLDAVYRETLRLSRACALPEPHVSPSHPLFSLLQAISIPLSAPIELSNGELVSELPVAKGQTILVSIEAVNRDPAIWGPDADRWVPERWLEDLPPSVHAAEVPGTFAHTLSLLGGNRSCIGMKYAEVELTLVENFEFAPAPGHEEIKWRLSLMQNPSLPGREHLEEPELPLLVTMVKAAETECVA
ncbi:Cytochrome P450 [Mycena venus]|uniref:Cytochrome P450 n=1 Tax=Mycena venus TaxID=2733690 RepID=A0A8H6X5V7_9AGAR|nr:Cytochrome P450 [Mycena venus]